MTATTKLRLATIDSDHAIDIACLVVESAVGPPVQAEFQEIEGDYLIVELELGNEAITTANPSRLVSAVNEAASDVEVLSAWRESECPEPIPQNCPDVLGVGYEPIPEAARRAIDDDLPTASWDSSDASWHLAVPAVCRGRAIVGMSHRRGYSHRFTAQDIAALRCGLHG